MLDSDEIIEFTNALFADIDADAAVLFEKDGDKGVKRFIGKFPQVTLEAAMFIAKTYDDGGRVICMETCGRGVRSLVTGEELEKTRVAK